MDGHDVVAIEPSMAGCTMRKATVNTSRSATLGIVTALKPVNKLCAGTIDQQDHEGKEHKNGYDIQQRRPNRSQQLEDRSNPPC